MPRVTLEELSEYQHKIEIPIRIYDLNFGNHVGVSEMIDIIHEARHQFFASLGVTELDLGDNKTGIVISDFVVNMKAEVFMGDVLLVESHIADIGEKSFRVYHRIRKNGMVAALAETGLVSLDFTQRKPVLVPGIFKEALKKC